mmetsp:Transcript_26472/g.91116  ORF Transcript_26472/g.91116 Transcript_26472/m.91116 type:complete len:349 (-) Transcript_26472:747-1793(-)
MIRREPKVRAEAVPPPRRIGAAGRRDADDEVRIRAALRQDDERPAVCRGPPSRLAVYADEEEGQLAQGQRLHERRRVAAERRRGDVGVAEVLEASDGAALDERDGVRDHALLQSAGGLDGRAHGRRLLVREQGVVSLPEAGRPRRRLDDCGDAPRGRRRAAAAAGLEAGLDDERRVGGGQREAAFGRRPPEARVEWLLELIRRAVLFQRGVQSAPLLRRQEHVLLPAVLQREAHLGQELLQPLAAVCLPDAEAACDIIRVVHGIEQRPVPVEHELELLVVELDARRVARHGHGVVMPQALCEVPRKAVVLFVVQTPLAVHRSQAQRGQPALRRAGAAEALAHGEEEHR